MLEGTSDHITLDSAMFLISQQIFPVDAVVAYLPPLVSAISRRLRPQDTTPIPALLALIQLHGQCPQLFMEESSHWVAAVLPVLKLAVQECAYAKSDEQTAVMVAGGSTMSYCISLLQVFDKRFVNMASAATN